MKKIKILLLLVNIGLIASAQDTKIIPDLLKVKDTSLWELKNRDISILNNKIIHLNSKKGDGALWLKDLIFSNGIIECDIKGQDIRGKSFVGIVFHAENETEYDVIYCRPFNFENPQRKNHSIQYIAHPKNTWFYLRKNFPQKYENKLNTSISPEDWFHVKIIINFPDVAVYVNNSETPSLKIEQISSRKKGKVGFWVGNYSEGWFKNLTITKKD